MSILAVVFAAIMPVFSAVRNHSETAGADSEMVQNARVLNEQLYRQLAQAKRITAVSGSTDVDGYVEFEDADETTQRCQRASSGYVEFGAVGDLSDLAGPVEYLKFTCYDGNDPTTQTVVPDHIRLVTWEARLDSAGALAGDKTIRGACYLRVGSSSGPAQTDSLYDFATGRQGVDCFAYAGEGSPAKPSALGTPSNLLTPAEYDAIEAQDDNLYRYDVSTSSNYARMRFVFTIREDESAVTQITATWRGKGVNSHPPRTDGASLYAWNYNSGSYKLLQASASTEALITLTGSKTSTADRFIGGSGNHTVVLLVASNDYKKNGTQDNKLYTDYVRLDVRTSGSGGVLP